MSSEADALPEDTAGLQAMVLGLQAKVAGMAAANRAYEALVQALKITIARLKKQRFGASSETIRLYCGRVNSSGAGGVFGLAEENEDIRVRAMPADEAIALLDGGTLVNAPVIIALHWLARRREQLRRLWAGPPSPQSS